jgi:hypothetical protein
MVDDSIGYNTGIVRVCTSEGYFFCNFDIFLVRALINDNDVVIISEIDCGLDGVEVGGAVVIDGVSSGETRYGQYGK